MATYNARTQQFNSALATMLDGLEANNPAITLLQLDVAGLFQQVLADPSAFGFTNVTDPAAPGLDPGASSYDTSQVAPNPDEFLFWDEIHPTTAGHALLASAAMQLFSLPGDFNGDGNVDAADYVVWRTGFGTTFTQHDYNLWRANFGRTGGSAAMNDSATRAAVPEPATFTGLLVGSIMALASGRRFEIFLAGRRSYGKRKISCAI
jgi:hypothetical protein